MGLAIDFSKLEPVDVLDIAVAAEREARDSYQQIADWMRGHGNLEVADFFASMARLEQAHTDLIGAQRRRLFGDREPRHRDTAAWEVESPDYDRIGLDMSVRAAYDAALDAEVKAHDYYAGALEYVTDPGVEALFAELRDAEAQHQRMIQRQIARLEGREARDAE